MTASTPTPASTAASAFASERAEGFGKGTVGWLVDRWVATKTDITEKSQMQNRWAAGHISKALGAIRLNQLDRQDIADWYDQMAAGGLVNKRSITPSVECCEQLWRMRSTRDSSDATRQRGRRCRRRS